jgi:phosphatidylglycerophosphatase A
VSIDYLIHCWLKSGSRSPPNESLAMLFLLDLPPELARSDGPVIAATWFLTGLVEPLRAGLAVATVWPVAALMSQRAHGRAWLLLTTLVLLVVGTWASTAWETASSITDDRRIVIDEVAGYLLVIALAGRSSLLQAGLLGAIFLAVDRLKPWPIYLAESVPGGFGVMFDDIVAGLAVALGLFVFRRLSPRKAGNS